MLELCAYCLCASLGVVLGFFACAVLSVGGREKSEECEKTNVVVSAKFVQNTKIKKR